MWLREIEWTPNSPRFLIDYDIAKRLKNALDTNQLKIKLIQENFCVNTVPQKPKIKNPNPDIPTTYVLTIYANSSWVRAPHSTH